MERPVPVLQQRTTPFNPEAAAFNPGFSSPPAFDTRLGSPSITDAPQSPFRMAPMFNYSPFTGPGDMQSRFRRDPLTPAPVRLEDFLSPDVQALMKKLEEHPDVQEIRAPHTPDQEPAKATGAVAKSIPGLPHFMFPDEQSRSKYTTVDINELSAGLGLPTAKTDASDDVSTSASHKSRVLQAHPGALYGKLIGWALDKPLTAKGLADFLQNQEARTSVEALAPMPIPPTGAIFEQDNKSSPTRSEMKSSMEADLPGSERVAVPSLDERLPIPKGPSASQHEHRCSSVSSGSYRRHARIPSNRRYPRRASRAKRIDQGPMPSAADIYPDDAHWTPAAPIYEAQDYTSFQQEPVEHAQVIIGNPFNWPLPAQAYQPEHVPTAADIDAADIDVLALMKELPEPSLDTLARLGNSHDLRISTTFDLPCDERALTPGQEDGSRYGLRFYGLGYGDEWDLLKSGDFGDGDPFRVRPRDHDGWGGHEGAWSRGWIA